LKEGEVSPVVESSYGYHIFRLDRRYEPDLVPESEAAPDIKMRLLDQKIKQALAQNLEELKRSMDWSSYPQNLSFFYKRNNL
jgi:parvulin-like peptidyl-prolyl isomerase